MEHACPTAELRSVVSTLAATRRRHQMRRILIALCLSTIIGISTFVILSFVTRVLGIIFPPAPIAALAALICAAVGLYFAVRRAPSIWSIARAADHAYRLDETLSTALEMAHVSPPRRSVVIEALYRDAARSGEIVHPPDLAPLFPRSLVLLGAIVIASTMALWVSEVAQPSFEVHENIAATVNDDPIAAKPIEALAQQIAADARSRRDPYLEAVSRSLSALSRELTSREKSTKSDETRLSELLDHAAQAYGDQPPRWLGNLQSDRSKLRAGLQKAATGIDPSRIDAQHQDATQTNDASLSPRLPAPLGSNTAKDATHATAETSTADSSVPSENSEFSDGDYELQPADRLQLERERKFAEQQRQKIEGSGEPVGGAQDADRGGNMAGLGSQPLTDKESKLLARSPTQELELSSNDRHKGRTIRMEALPSQRDRIMPTDAIVARNSWSRQTEAIVERESVSPSQAEIGRAYFSQHDTDDARAAP